MPKSLDSFIAELPKAELHLHLEGSISPKTAVELAARHGITLTEAEVAARYATPTFLEFLESFKWVTSLLRAPADYALIASRLAEYLLSQNAVYAEVTLSIGVMLLRKQDPLANFAAMRAAVAQFEKPTAAHPLGLRINWIFDAVRHFGADAAMQVAKLAAQTPRDSVVAFGIGGDELGLPTSDLIPVYEFARAAGLAPLIHAGEIGGPEKIREAIEFLHVVRIGHGIAAMHDESLMDLLTARRIPLELCPTSNLRTGGSRSPAPSRKRFDRRNPRAPAKNVFQSWRPYHAFHRRSHHVRNFPPPRIPTRGSSGLYSRRPHTSRSIQFRTCLNPCIAKAALHFRPQKFRDPEHSNHAHQLAIIPSHESSCLGNAQDHRPRSSR